MFDRLGLPFTTDDGPELRGTLERLFKTRSRDEWCALLEGTDACFAPVLSMAEAPHHPHNVARGSFVEVDGVVQPAAAPRFSRTPAARPTPPEEVGADTRTVLRGWDIPKEKIEALLADGVLVEAESQQVAAG